MNSKEIEDRLLRLLYVRPLAVQDISNPSSAEMVRETYPDHAQFLIPDNYDAIYQAVWALISRELVWLNMAGHSSPLWRFALTDRGRRLAVHEEPNPDNGTEYMDRLLRSSPDTSEVVKMYLKEALLSYAESCYLASTVMLGVAAEASMLDAAADYVQWAGKKADKLREHLENSRTFYVVKLQEFQKRLAVDRPSFANDLADSLDLDVTAVLQLIRLTRNDAGHPTGKKIDREDCFSRLSIYASVHKKLHALRAFFQLSQQS